jgi:hypothetical protein
MTRAASLLLTLALAGCLVPVREGRRAGQAEGLSLRLTLPVLLPPLIVIEPGVSVFSDLDEEVFFADGAYWARQDAQWYRAPDPHGAWTRADRTRVAPALVRLPPGRYRHWRGSERGGSGREEGWRYGLEERTGLDQ